eukprot:gene30613-31164_t
MKPIVLIPARMAATRLPNKPLADIGGVAMIVRVLRQAEMANIGPVAVAAGDQEIVEAVLAAGGQAVLTDYLASHRDAYKYLHDQSVRLMNQGYVGDEIASRIALPPVLANQWFNRGYYGTMSFNSRAVYQRYMGWYNANPVNLIPIPPADLARRYVEAMGGAGKVKALAQA